MQITLEKVSHKMNTKLIKDFERAFKTYEEDGFISIGIVKNILSRHAKPTQTEGRRVICEWAEGYCHAYATGKPCHKGLKEYDHTCNGQPPEPLAVLADRKGCRITYIDGPYHCLHWAVGISTGGQNNRGFIGENYTVAETAARTFLSGLEDVKGGMK